MGDPGAGVGVGKVTTSGSGYNYADELGIREGDNDLVEDNVKEDYEDGHDMGGKVSRTGQGSAWTGRRRSSSGGSGAVDNGNNNNMVIVS